MFLFHRDDRKFVPTTGPWLINFGMINHNQVYNREQCTLNSKLGDSSIISSLPIRHPDFFFFFWICFLFILSVYYRKPAKLTHGYLFDLKKNAKQKQSGQSDVIWASSMSIRVNWPHRSEESGRPHLDSVPQSRSSSTEEWAWGYEYEAGAHLEDAGSLGCHPHHSTGPSRPPAALPCCYMPILGTPTPVATHLPRAWLASRLWFPPLSCRF